MVASPRRPVLPPGNATRLSVDLAGHSERARLFGEITEAMHVVSAALEERNSDFA